MKYNGLQQVKEIFSTINKLYALTENSLIIININEIVKNN